MSKIKVMELLFSNQWMVYPSAMIGFVNILSKDNSLDNSELAQLIHGQNFKNYVNEENKIIVPESLQVLNRFPRLDGSYNLRMRGKNSIIPMIGVIYPRSSSSPSFSESVVLDQKSHDFKIALNDKSIENIVFYADSPGGAAQSTAEFAREVYEARGVKNIVTYVSGMNASAMYYISSATSMIYASSSSLNGNIGTIIQMNKDEDSNTQYIISKQSPNKIPDIKTKKGLAQLQNIVDDLGEDFVGDVAEFKGMTSQEVIEKFDGGAIFTGKRALKIGMIDEIISFDNLMNKFDSESKYNPKKTSLQGANNMDLETLKQEHPDLYTSVLNSGKILGDAEGHKRGNAEGVKAGTDEGLKAGMVAENERIKGIDTFLNIPGAKKLIAEAKSDPEATKETLAIKILASQSAKTKTQQSILEKEKEELGQQSKEIDAGDDGLDTSAQDKKDEEAALEQMQLGAESSNI